jgi:hypothetical protein
MVLLIFNVIMTSYEFSKFKSVTLKKVITIFLKTICNNTHFLIPMDTLGHTL